jgi:hypothetical protein
MKRTTIFLEEAADRELRLVAERKGVAAARVLREAIDRYLGEERRKTPRSLRFLAAGRSGTRKTAQRQEDFVFRDLEPHAATAKTRRKPSRKL